MEREEAVKKAINDCIDNDILKDFLEKNTAEVIKMMVSELYLQDLLAVRNMDDESRKNIARNALADGIPIEQVQIITDLDIEVISNIQSSIQHL